MAEGCWGICTPFSGMWFQVRRSGREGLSSRAEDDAVPNGQLGAKLLALDASGPGDPNASSPPPPPLPPGSPPPSLAAS